MFEGLRARISEFGGPFLRDVTNELNIRRLTDEYCSFPYNVYPRFVAEAEYRADPRNKATLGGLSYQVIKRLPNKVLLFLSPIQQQN